MSVAILESEASQSQFEISADSIEDLQFLNVGLTSVIAKQRVAERDPLENTDEHTLDLAESLREEVAKDVEATARGEQLEHFHYVVQEKEFVVEALQIASQITEPRYATPTAPATHVQLPADTRRAYPPVIHQRITSFYDPRLDEQPHRWFSR